MKNSPQKIQMKMIINDFKDTDTEWDTKKFAWFTNASSSTGSHSPMVLWIMQISTNVCWSTCARNSYINSMIMLFMHYIRFSYDASLSTSINRIKQKRNNKGFFFSRARVRLHTFRRLTLEEKSFWEILFHTFTFRTSLVDKFDELRKKCAKRASALNGLVKCRIAFDFTRTISSSHE